MKSKSHSPPLHGQRGDQPCLASVYPRLAKAGFTRKFIRTTVLPSWVCDQAEKDPDVFPELALFLGKALGINSRSLVEPNGPIVFCNPSLARYKPATGTVLAEERITAAKTVNQQIALEVEACLPEDPSFVANTLDPVQIRSCILESSRKLDFKSLLAYCWHLGIPVLPAVNLHQSKSALRFTGMITWQKERPFIFLRGNAEFTSWGLFVLAHELAHLALEHVKRGDALVEESCDPDSASDEEVAANEWALSLILGDHRDAMSNWISATSRITAKQLAARASKEQSLIGVDAGFLILKAAWERSSGDIDPITKKIAWSTARAALNEPCIGNEHTKPLMLDALRIKGDLSVLSAEERGLVVRALGLDK